ncbi:GntR family transcriptional regulator [Agaricicola taiwanensis]|nr:GntR family transcriptional regulator [Agaricicola taiwanensis]
MSTDEKAMEAVTERRDRTLTLVARDRLEELILTGELQAGSRLNELTLSRQLGVSRGPIREAARLLERDGLVSSIANQGVFVRQLSVEDAVELYEMRAVIAGYACSCLAKRAGKEEKAELRRLVEEMDQCIIEVREDDYFVLNLRFHDRIAELSGGRRTSELYSSLGKEVRLLRRRVLRGKDAMEFSNGEHKEILKAIELGDVATARDAAEQHHISGKRRWLETL